MITKETLLNAQNRLDLSNNALVNLAASLRADNVQVESGLTKDLYEVDTLLEEHFDVKNFNLEEKRDGEISMVSKPVVFCKDVSKFVAFVKEKRNIKGAVSLKYGADGGGMILL